MQKIKETDPRFVFLKGKIFLFIAIALIGIIILLFFIGKQRGMFIKTEDFYFITTKATGLYNGMPVKVSGFKIGRLKNMNLQDDGTVKIILSIEQSHAKWFREGSVAVLTKEGFIGESYIEILPGKGQPLKSGEAIKFFRQAGIEEIAAELKGEISEILKGIKETINYVNEPQGSVKKSLENIEKISKNLINTTEELNALLKELNSKTPQITQKTEKTIEELTELIKSLQKLSKELNETATTIKSATKKDIPVIIEQTKKSMQDADEILQSIKGLWPIREGIKKQEIKPLESDSYEP
ncbi:MULTISPECIES: MlaD family protein [Thermodesulfovibrio]|uniref:Mce related protein n=1 Tax=Thermodesulfovibrio yellowstonii (strain ATCC 51303 / DSM 11347 / YP87) TaxID=289376 RepID=B5YHU7_THEYD|nr:MULTISPECIES: MlaD family protein [Thermodesulfovibrio]ACI22181.1 mce related protein [Thermodesulfovibrio yellowstonii DSM 11347]MDI6865857.1 MlaD family protein [Thermodesulfovibrio yellowstonii]